LRFFSVEEAENKTEIENPIGAGGLESQVDKQISIETEVKDEL